MDQVPLVQAPADVAGTVVQSPIWVGSAEIVVTPLAVAPSSPVPADRSVVLWKERQSVPPAEFQAPPVAVQVNNGMELDGNAVIPETATQPEEQPTVRLCPTVRFPLGSR